MAQARTGAETRREAQRIALRLFTTQGYDATSLQQIADELGIRKASLYYHFAGKEAIVASLLEERFAEAARLLAWTKEQPRDAGLPSRAVARWLDAQTSDKLQGIRFLAANPTLMRRLAGPEPGIRESFGELVVLLSGRPAGDPRTVLVSMALLSLNAAVAAAPPGTPDAAVIAAARASAEALVGAAEGM